MEAVPQTIEPNVKISVKKLLTPSFTESFDKLKRVPTFSGEMTFKIRRMGKKIEKELEIYNELRLEDLKKVAKKDEAGEPIISINDKGFETYQILPEHRAGFDKRVAELQKTEVDLEKISFSELGHSHGLSAHDLMQLDFIVE
jgi:HAMP domain-containing protein